MGDRTSPEPHSKISELELMEDKLAQFKDQSDIRSLLLMLEFFPVPGADVITREDVPDSATKDQIKPWVDYAKNYLLTDLHPDRDAALLTVSRSISKHLTECF